MKHLIAMTILAGAFVAGGCNSDDSKPTAAGSSASAGPANSSAKPAQKLYFELNKGGKTYVFGNIATLQAVNSGQPPANLIEAAGPNGEPVVYETGGAGALEKRLMEEYVKQHPRK